MGEVSIDFRLIQIYRNGTRSIKCTCAKFMPHSRTCAACYFSDELFKWLRIAFTCSPSNLSKPALRFQPYLNSLKKWSKRRASFRRELKDLGQYLAMEPSAISSRLSVPMRIRTTIGITLILC